MWKNNCFNCILLNYKSPINKNFVWLLHYLIEFNYESCSFWSYIHTVADQGSTSGSWGENPLRLIPGMLPEFIPDENDEYGAQSDEGEYLVDEYDFFGDL